MEPHPSLNTSFKPNAPKLPPSFDGTTAISEILIESNSSTTIKSDDIEEESSEDEVDEAQFNLWFETQLKHMHKNFVTQMQSINEDSANVDINLVNPKQYSRILSRRLKRANTPIDRYKHIDRHLLAVVRDRNKSGQFKTFKQEPTTKPSIAEEKPIKKKSRGRPANPSKKNKELIIDQPKKSKVNKDSYKDEVASVPLIVPIDLPSITILRHEAMSPFPQLPDYTTFDSMNWEISDTFADNININKDSNPAGPSFVNW